MVRNILIKFFLPLELKVTIPNGVMATIKLPDGTTLDVVGGRYSFTAKFKNPQLY